MPDVFAFPTRRPGEVSSSFLRMHAASCATNANKSLQRKIPTGLADGYIACLSSTLQHEQKAHERTVETGSP